MFLKSLTLKGFKSFADKTTLEFEPGVCVVVGPNGSGKSNVVDSVVWVLGAQGARALRGGKMDDVIFAGTTDRPALGRAEVSLTIDNSAHLLPIEFSEVTITRMLFRSGESEYMINGAPCRLLDIQDLLSDTGIGRQQHVIVGQGQLDAVLNARPEDRRAIIEEAAGILKFRKRKEKAERRLQATEGNLLRLGDLLREVRRQLRPLERQADAARRHDGLVAELNAIKLHLVGREIEQLRTRETKREAARGELARREQDVRVQLRSLDAAIIEAEQALIGPGEDDVADLLARTEALRERSRGLVNLVTERRRGLDRELAAVADEGVVASLVDEAAQLREELARLGLDPETTVELELPDLMSAQHDLATSEAAVRAADAAHRTSESEASRCRARAETLAQALDAAHAAGGGDAIADLNGVLGPLVTNIEIAGGAEVAVAAALGDALNAVVVEGASAARDAVERLKQGDGAALLLVSDASEHAQTTLAPPGTLPLSSCVHGLRPGLDAVLARLLAPFVLVDAGWQAALDIALADPGVIAVTRDGDRFGGSSPWRAGPLGSSAVTPAVLNEALARATEAEAARDLAESEVELQRQRLAAARRAELVADEADRRHRSDIDRATAAHAERRSVLSARLAAVEARLAVRPDEEAEARARRAVVERRRGAIDDIAVALASRADEIEVLVERLRARRRAQSEAARNAGRRLDGLRRERATAEQQLVGLRDEVGRLEIEQTEIRMRLEQAVERVRTEFDCEPEIALGAPPPEVLEGISLHGRARELERELRLMGPINPLALSEYEALLERHEFLQNQLDDVRNTRRELARVIKAVDEEIVTVFNTAFDDVARNFSELFAMLFPGGAGRLVLSQPEDPLNTGIEMEARPSGKMVRRLSLLSGGERSLCALAYLFAVFRARPSPFYLMDEVEAALDDVNLHRFLDLVHEFRNEAQLLIVSHQKRTMEAADVLYGVSMPPGGSSRVVSQRMSDLQFEGIPGVSKMFVAESADAACGEHGRTWLCHWVTNVTDDTTAAHVARYLSPWLSILLIALLAFIVSRITRRIIKRTMRRWERGTLGGALERRHQRAVTIGAGLASFAAIVIWVVAGVWMLSVLGVSAATLLTSAGLIGVALAFGAQNLLRDLIAGTFIIFEDQLGVGDVVDLGVASGTVEEVTLRTTQLRDVEGVVWHVPNGEIRRVGNKSQQWARAVVDIPISHGANVDRAQEVIQAAANEVAADPQWAEHILDPPDVQGVESFTLDALTIRLVVRTKPSEQWRVARAMRARIKPALDAAGIASTEVPVAEAPGSTTDDSGAEAPE